MLKVEKVVVGSQEIFQIAIEGMRNPKNSWDRIDSGFVDMEVCEGQAVYHGTEFAYKIGENDMKLMKSLCNGGPVHAKFRRMLPIYMTVTAPIFWWSEFDTYKVGTVRNSCSKMHKIHSLEIVKDDFAHEGIDDVAQEFEGFGYFFDKLIQTLEWLRVEFNETGDKKYWRALIELIPEGYQMKSTIEFDYETASQIYFWRHNHKVSEWHTFCDAIKELPYAEDIIICKKESN